MTTTSAGPPVERAPTAARSEPLRVLMLLDRYWPHVGGVEVVVKALCDVLNASVARVSVLSRNYTGELARSEDLDGVRIARRGRSPSRRWSKLQFLVASTWYLITKRHSYDLVHVHVQQHELDLLPVTIARLLTRKPFVVHFHRSEAIAWMLKLRAEGPSEDAQRINLLPAWFYRAALRAAHARIAVEQETVRVLERHRLGDSVYVPNAVRISTEPVRGEEKARLRRELDLPTEEGLVVTTVGVLRPEKNHITLLRAWNDLMSRWSGGDARLVILGGAESTGSEVEQELRRYMTEHGLASVDLRGSVPNVVDFLRASDLYVHPSLLEGTSLAIIEAMSSGLPVIVSDIPGNRDLVRSAEEGVRVAPMDHEGLAAEMERLLGDAAARARLGREAQARAKEAFGMDRVAAAVAGVYASVGAG